ncbi:MAG: hypothetical protein J6B12_01505 [Clostridia bacterium]|nr:hypothetical protein [Clostridia bacterium]
MNNSKIKILQYIILILCAIVFIVCAVFLVKAAIDYHKADSFYDDMTIDGSGEVLEPSDDEETPESVIALMKAYQELKAQYPNIIGYINIPSI